MTNNNFAIEIKDLSKKFVLGSETIQIFDNFSMSLERESSLVITGPSGCGKTTFLHMLASLEDLDSGEIISCGKNLGKLNEKELSLYRIEKIGLMFQFHYLMKELTALENVLLPARLKNGGITKTDISRAEELLEITGMSSRRNHYPSLLSGGERQRISLCRAFINNPELILADEPTGNLDPKNAKLVEDLLFELVKNFKKNIVIVTHDLHMAKRADYLLDLQDKNTIVNKVIS